MARKKEPNYPVFTEAEFAEIRSCANSVWNEVGYDVLDSMAKHGYAKPRDINTVSMSRRDVIEIVLDANRMDDMLKRSSKELFEKFDVLDYEEKKKIVRGGFPFTRYGL